MWRIWEDMDGVLLLLWRYGRAGNGDAGTCLDILENVGIE